MDVVEGTAAVVLGWVGDDPARAQAALDAEYLAPTPRTTLISKLETIAAQAAQEDPVSDAPAETAEAPPEQPPGDAPKAEVPEPAVDLADNATVIGTRNVRTPDIEVPDDNFDAVAAQAKEADEPAPLDAEPVDFFQVASTNGALALRVGDSVHLFDHDQAIALSRELRQALANVTY